MPTNSQIPYNKMQILSHIFWSRYSPENPQPIIDFYLSDVGEAGEMLGMTLPTSYSNIVLDLCRQNRGIDRRLPGDVVAEGYDLRKKTGPDATSTRRFCGQFVYVGLGNEINSWLRWPTQEVEIKVDPRDLDKVQRSLLRQDEAALASVVLGLNLITKITNYQYDQVMLVQTPIKLQPNEIDALFFSTIGDKVILFPVEAKALTTGDEINIDQLAGGYRTLKQEAARLLPGQTSVVRQIAAVMVENGIDFAIFDEDVEPGADVPFKFLKVVFEPPLSVW